MHNSKIEMRTESTDVTDQHQNIILRSNPSCNEQELHDALETSLDIAEEHIVGRTEEKEKVVAYLLEAMSEKIVILPVYGIGGIGKTTFARLIYNDPKFNCYSQVWVHVSQRQLAGKSRRHWSQPLRLVSRSVPESLRILQTIARLPNLAPGKSPKIKITNSIRPATQNRASHISCQRVLG